MPMKHGWFVAIFFGVTFLYTADAQPPANARPIVRLLYVFPSDRHPQSDIDVKMDKLIKDVQEFYADQMQAHGFERKTFQVVTDGSGRAVVHRIRGRFKDAHYRKSPWSVLDDVKEALDSLQTIYLIALDVSTELIGFASCGQAGPYGDTGGLALIPASGSCFDIMTAAHELGHTFHLAHDNRGTGKWIASHGVLDRMITSFCAAEWLDVYPAFNPNDTAVPKKGVTTVKMLSSSLAFAPDTLRLRFNVSNPNGLHQAQLHAREEHTAGSEVGGIMDCQALNGSRSTLVEFVTNQWFRRNEAVRLQIIDTYGNLSWSEFFAIDVGALLPPPRVVSISDPILAAAVREEIGDSITTHTLRELTRLSVKYPGIADLSDISILAELTRLKGLLLNAGSISDLSPLASLTYLRDLSLDTNGISDLSALATLTHLRDLGLGLNAISDLSPLANLTELESLRLWDNAISDLSPLANLNLKSLNLSNNAISDVSALVELRHLQFVDLRENPLSYASIHTYIPALQANGTQVKFDDHSHPALLKISGDTQKGTPGEALSKPLIVEAVDALGTPMRGVFVAFAVTTGDARLNPMTTTTDANGRAQTTLIFRRTPGKHTVSVSATGIQASITFTAHATGPSVYWVDKIDGTLHRAVGSKIEPLVPGVQNATSLALDVANNTLYWTQQTGPATGKIQRAYLDGRGVQLLKNLTSVPHGIALDTAGGKIYVTNSWGKVQRLNVDGSDFQPNLITGLASPQSLVVDGVGNKLYWTEQTGNVTGKIQRAHLDGSNVELVKSLTSLPRSLALDTAHARLYLTNAWGKVQRLNVDGSDFQPNLIIGLASPEGIAVDGVGNKLYWAETGGIRCADLDGGNIQNIVSLEATPSAITVELPPEPFSAAPMETFRIATAPETTTLLANYPNPFNPETWIPYQLAEPTEVSLHIYAVNGRLVRVLAFGHQLAGIYKSQSRAAHWDGRNEVGEPVASGVYFYTLTAGDFTATRKLLIRK